MHEGKPVDPEALRKRAERLREDAKTSGP